LTVRIYRSSDSGAPTLTGEAGSLVNVLDKCLVAGYGSSTAAGWTMPYTGTNAATFRTGAGTQYYLVVNDNGPGAGGYQEARARGYEVCTAHDTGTSPFPTVAQSSAGVFVRKSASAESVARGWMLVADERTMYFYAATGDYAGVYYGLWFGDIYSYKSNDLGRCMIVGRIVENAFQAHSAYDRMGCIDRNFLLEGSHYLARDLQGGGSMQFGKTADHSIADANNFWAGTLAYKNAADNEIYIAPVRLYQQHGGNTVRGRLRGIWYWCHPATACADGDTFSGGGDLVGRTFMILKSVNNESGAGAVVIETSNTWDTN
jgi:hypothetical protein